MKRTLAILLAALLLNGVCAASLLLDIPAPHDDGPVKLALWTNAETSQQIMADRKAYYTLEERLRTLSEGELKAMFGAEKARVPQTFALPVHRHPGVGFSGLGYKGDEKSYFLEIGEVGGVLVFPYGNGEFISAVALYLKTDAGFVALKTPASYAARRAWEIQRTGELQKEIEAAFKKRPLPIAPAFQAPTGEGRPLSLEIQPPSKP